MDEVIEAKQQRLYKLHKDWEFHGWLVHDKWIQNKVYKDIITGTYKEISYITYDKYNPLPFHKNIEYMGVIHDNKKPVLGKPLYGFH